MSNWFQRSRRGQRDLARGVDAGLVRDNQRRFKVAFALMGVGLLLAVLSAEVRTHSVLYSVLFDIGMAGLAAGFLLAMWARSEAGFLNEPDPEERPAILKR